MSSGSGVASGVVSGDGTGVDGGIGTGVGSGVGTIVGVGAGTVGVVVAVGVGATGVDVDRPSRATCDTQADRVSIERANTMARSPNRRAAGPGCIPCCIKGGRRFDFPNLSRLAQAPFINR